ncbi:hypothetical protein NQZ68_026416 [Dissostichus eleginoides]|nr:hypothetical protein NQZ68_026416 [Dissostichus eleginoides]
MDPELKLDSQIKVLCECVDHSESCTAGHTVRTAGGTQLANVTEQSLELKHNPRTVQSFNIRTKS